MTPHFTAERWADYVRGLGAQDVRARMARHLAEGCAQCNGLVQLLEDVGQVVRGNAAMAPPAWVVDREILRFDDHTARRCPPLVASLVSIQRPQSGSATDRAACRLIYRALDAVLELSLTPAPDGAVWFVSGRIHPGRTVACAGCLVSAHGSDDASASAAARTDAAGQFAVVCPSQEGARLEIICASTYTLIDVPLGRDAASQPTPADQRRA